MRVVCAMSGGVDSSVAASVLLEQGHEVVGMTMRLYDTDGREHAGRGEACCSPAEVDQAAHVCHLLGIPHYTVDERRLFAKKVVEPFVRDYALGRTPNPCTRCNRWVKFAPLWRRARALGADCLATGHYARARDGVLLRALDRSKDQSYFLFAMGQEHLGRVCFPLGETTKEQTRIKARALGLPNWDAPDSQELCFVPGADHGKVVEMLAPDLGVHGDALAPGPIVDGAGHKLGEHAGIHRVTVGQRRGLKVPGSARRYVLRVRPADRVVVVGSAEDLQSWRIEVGELQRLGLPRGRGILHAQVQIRHRSPSRPALIEHDDARATVTFEEPVSAAAPGQAAVFYAGDRVLGGGWIV